MKIKQAVKLCFIYLIFGLFVIPIQGQPTTELTTKLKKEIIKAVSKAIDKYAYVYGTDFSRWKTIAAAHETDFANARTNNDFAREVNTAFGEFGISHLDLRTPAEAAQRQSGNSTKAGVSGGRGANGYEIYTVRAGSPAETAGLQAGDIIVSVDGKTYDGGLAGAPGQRIKLQINRSGRLLDIVLEIKEWTLASDSLRWLDKKTVMIAVRSFADSHYKAEMIERLFADAAQAETIVLDLRGNGGGNAANVMHLLNLILPTRTKVGTFVEKADIKRFKAQFNREPRDLAELVQYGEMLIEARNINDQDVERFKAQFKREPKTIDELIKFVARPASKIFTGNILVVNDRANGSGAEIFARGVQDLKRGIVVGDGRTYGAVLLGDTVVLPGKFELHIVTADYVTVAGKRIEGNGVEPDIKLEANTIGNNEDLKKALLRILMR